MILRKTSTMARFFAITASFLLFTNGSGAVPAEEWNRTFEGAALFYVVQTHDEGFIIAGSTNYGAWLIKTDPEGHVQWNRTYPTKGIRKVSTARDGGYILRGVSNDSDFWLMKTDANGQEQWNRTLIVKNNTTFSDIEETSDGGSVIAVVEHIAPSEKPYWQRVSRLIKVDVSGNEQWNMTFKRQNEFDVRSVQQTKDGGYVLAGSMTLSPGYYPLPGIPLMDYGNSDAAVIKTDPNGNQQWEKTFGWWAKLEGAKAVVQTADGGYMIDGLKGGFRLFDTRGVANQWLIKIDPSGNEQWNRDFGKSWGPFFSSIQQTKDGGYIFVSSTKYETAGIHDWLIKIDANGNMQWKKVLEGTEVDEVELMTHYSIEEGSDHSYILAGYTALMEGNINSRLVKIRDTNISALVRKRT